MESEQDWLDESFEEMIATDEGSPTADEAATEAAAPGDESLLETESPTADDAATAIPEPIATAAADPATPIEQGEAQAAPSPIDWTHPELAALKADRDAAAAKAQQFDGLQAVIAQAKAQKQAQDFQNRLTELADGDPERLQHLNGMVAQVAAPAVQQAHAAIAERDQIGKAFSAFVVSARANLPEETFKTLMAEMEPLMAVDDPHLMERTAFGKREVSQQFQTQLSQKDQQIRDLQLQLAARSELSQRGNADLVDGGGGGGAGTDWEHRLDQADDMDAYMSVLFG